MKGGTTTIEDWLRATHVAKTIRPGARGAIKLTRRHGAALVCVRYRVDPARHVRYTTVELVVDRARVRPRAPKQAFVELQLPTAESTLAGLLLENGAKRLSANGEWRVPTRVAKRLGLLRLVTPR